MFDFIVLLDLALGSRRAKCCQNAQENKMSIFLNQWEKIEAC